MKTNQDIAPSRHAQRALIVEKLYTMDMNDTTEYRDCEHDFVNAMIRGILDSAEKINSLISDHLQRWTLKRLSYVDRAILRLATYEMYATNTPGEIIINEALNLTRTFTDEGDEKAVHFNNSVLDKIKKTLKK